MIRQLLLAVVAVLGFGIVGCSAPPDPVANDDIPVSINIPKDGVTLRELGLTNAPEGVSIPRGTTTTEKIDQVNNVTVVFTAPTGAQLAGYLRRTLPDAGFEITQDANNSMLFTRGPWQGAFTSNNGYSAISFRTDREPA